MHSPLPKISESYSGKSIFITGSTGFLGKVLLEKLLFSFPDIKNIYILMRDKRGVKSKERFDKFLSHEIFQRVRQTNPSALEKLCLVEGDCLSHELAIKEDDRKLLIKSVNVIFHVVAQVKFNQPIQSAVDFNVNGTLQVLNLATEMQNLEHFVYISTAYVNPWKRQVPEMVEPFSLTGWIPNEVLILTESQKEDLNERIDNGRKYPNTYTLTKHMAEYLVADFSKKFKRVHTTIVRPSILTAAAFEPFIGWTDSFNGPAALMIEIARGTVKSVIGDGNKVADIIPVDLVANTIIASVWHQTIEGEKGIFKIYNCTSGSSNPIKWKTMGSLIVKYAKKYPTNHILTYPALTFRPKNVIHRVIVLFCHFLLSFMIDLGFKILNKKPKMLRIAKLVDAANEANAYFTSNEWNFENRNFQSIVDLLELGQSLSEFDCDVKSLDWDIYIRGHMIGNRKYLLKDPMETMSSAKFKVWSFFLIRTCSQMVVIYFLWSILST